MKLGFDLGSRNIHYVALDNDTVVARETTEHQGDVLGRVQDLIQGARQRFGAIESFGITGNTSAAALCLIDPVLACTRANRFLKTGCRHILAIGCETFALIFLDAEGNYLEHSFSSDCASGTGSFLDQQAKRLGYSTEEFADKAFHFQGKTPAIATRCSVFAKSDIIHSQAEGFSKDAIAAGICEGVVRSILSYTLGGRKPDGPLLLIGGVSRNRKIVSEIEKKLGVPVIVPENPLTFNALGAALLGNGSDQPLLDGLSDIRVHRPSREKLEIKLTRYPDFSQDKTYTNDGVEVILYRALPGETLNAFLGIDVGSTSTKCILLDENKTVLYGLYTTTAGDPVAAVAKLFKELSRIFVSKTLNIRGAAVTGSGRQIIKEITGADLAVNEITAHARGATFLDPDVDTIIEIGGQDSKFTLLKNGYVASSVMNYVCAAGTGSFIEEQAKKLDVPLAAVSDLALGQEAPLTSSRCTVYMERDLNTYIAEGWSKPQILASVLFSVRDNYLSKVAGRTLLGNTIYFQGATARNKALVAAFENEIGKPILVSKYCHLTGALGAAVILMETGAPDSRFRGIDLDFKTDSELCDLCANHCSLTVFNINGARVAWGMKCGRDYDERRPGRANPLSRLEQEYQNIFEPLPRPHENAKTVGIPLTLYMKEYAALFVDFFENLGLNLILERNAAGHLEQGKAIARADFCSPMLVIHGLVKALAGKKIDMLFLPAFINTQSLLDSLPEEEHFLKKNRDSYFCYYSEYAPTIVNNLVTLDIKDILVSPKIKLNNQPVEKVAEDIAQSLAGHIPLPQADIVESFLTAYRADMKRKAQWRETGTRRLASGKDRIKILLLGRPYVVFDRTINSGIPAKLEALGYELIHQSMLDLPNEPGPFSSRYLDRMHWYYGQQILLATETALKNDNIYPVFLTNFHCSPDAYVVTYFKEMMENAGKPYLVIQLDEHCSDIGYQTRLEAGMDAFLNDFNRRKGHPNLPIPGRSAPGASVYEPRITKDDIIYFPYLSPVLDEILIAAFTAHGYTAQILPVDPAMIHLGYKYVSGGECLPNVAVVGSIIDLFQKGRFDVKKGVLYLGDSCVACNFHQYTSLIWAACRKAGIKNLRIFSPKLGVTGQGLPQELSFDISASSVLGSLLYKLYFRVHPYEQEPGATQRALDRSIAIIKGYLNKKLPLWEIPVQKLGGELSELYIKHFINAGPTAAGAEPSGREDEKQKTFFINKIKEFLHPSKHLLNAAKEIRSLFEAIAGAGERKPRVGLLGDLYVKYNPVLNQDIYSLIEELGGEILIPSYLETGAHFMDAAVRESGADRMPLVKLTMYEKSFEEIFQGLLDEVFEPPVEECVELMRAYGIKHFIPGETTINVCRLLYYVKHKLVDAVIHLNPILCCPGSVTSSIYRKMQKDFNIPIVDIFYDGTNRPNRMIVPPMSTLKKPR
ncbi:MAG TPA: acyl-CoA dehydratase activase [Candidatus Omnitrophota bacterium]|nr:acyl-CoA dehydratase activase [Candidatus Omnitrophota bacterium]HPN56202.1 acyl-CoA dehydratase activase [Candidatus Omnitrophota bacterium]